MNDSNVLTIRNAIKTKVDQLGKLQGSFDYETGKNTGHPFATVTPVEGESEFGDSVGSGRGRNIQTMDFAIRVYQEREESGFGAEKAENVSIGVLDETLTAFHADTTLSGTVLWQRPVGWNMGYAPRESLVRTLEITIRATKEIDTI